MRIFLFIFVGIALGDKLDRTYLPPPGSKYSGGSPGALQTPLEYPKQTYSTTGDTGPNVGPIFASNQATQPKNAQQQHQEFKPSSLQSQNIGSTFEPINQDQQQLFPQGFDSKSQPAFETNIAQQQPGSQGFAPSGPQTLRPTFGSNQGLGNLRPGTPNFTPSSPQQPIFRPDGSTSGQPEPQTYLPNNQNRPNAAPTFGLNQGQLNSQGFIQPGQLADFQQSPFTSSSPLNNFQNNVPSTTTSYAFTHTTISPFDDVASTVPPFILDGQRPYDIPVQVRYPQNGFAPDQTTVFQQDQIKKQFPQQGITEQNQLTIDEKFPQQGFIPNDNKAFYQQQTIGQTQPSLNSQQNKAIGVYNQPGFFDPQDTRNQLQKQNYSQQISTESSTMQQGSLYPGSKFEPSFSQTGGSINNYQPPRGPGFQQGVSSTTTGSPLEIGEQFDNLVQISPLSEIQSQNQLQGFNNNEVQTTQQSPQTQYSTASPSQRIPQRPNQYQNQYGPVKSITASPFDQDYSTPNSQNIGGIGDNTQRKPGFFTTGLIPQPTVSGNFDTSTASPDLYSKSTPTYLGGQIQQGLVQNLPERVQAVGDRNAVILNYENNLTPEGEFSYSFDTSNGIHANANGTSIDGVKVQGSFSYTGDNGEVYSVTYSADENGFIPIGDHLPTPPPIPDAIKRVIEQAMRNKEAGISNDGSYDEAKYGYEKYKGKMDLYIPQSRYKFKKNKIGAISKQVKPTGVVSFEEFDNEDNVDYETLEDEIEDIRTGNKKTKTSNITGPMNLDSDTSIQDHISANKSTGNKTNYNSSVKTIDDIENKNKFGFNNSHKRPQITKSNRRKPVPKVKNTDEGYDNDTEEPASVRKSKLNQLHPTTMSSEDVEEDEEDYKSTKHLKHPELAKSDRQRPTNDTTEIIEEENINNEYDSIAKTPQTNKRKPSTKILTAGQHQDSETDFELKKRRKSDKRCPVSEKESLDNGIYIEYEDNQKKEQNKYNKVSPNIGNLDETKIPSKRPKPLNRTRPSSENSYVDNNNEGDDTDEQPEFFNSSSGSPEVEISDDRNKNKYETEFQSKYPLSSKSNRKRPSLKGHDKTMKEKNEDNIGYQSDKPLRRPVSFKPDRRRPGLESEENDDDKDSVVDNQELPKRLQLIKKQPTATTSDFNDRDEEDEHEDSVYENQKPLQRPMPFKFERPLKTYIQDKEEGVETDFEENKPSKRPKSNRKSPDDSVISSEDTENDYVTKKSLKKLESNNRRPYTSGNSEETSRRPVNRQPGFTNKFVDKNADLDSKIDAPTDGKDNIFRPNDGSFGAKDETSHNLDKSRFPTKSTEEPFDDFKAPANEYDYDYSLHEETNEKSTPQILENKKQNLQRKKIKNIISEEETEEGNNGNFLDQSEPTSNSSKKNQKAQKTRKPTGPQIFTSQDETNTEQNDTATGFEQKTPSSISNIPYSISKPFVKDSKEGYRYLPPQRKFYEQPGRISVGQNGDINLPNSGYFDRNRPSGFQSSSTIEPQFDAQQILPKPASGNQFETSSLQNVPDNDNEKESKENVTPTPFAASKPQSETYVTRRPYFGQTSQNIPSQNTQNYPIAENNTYQTPEMTPGGFSTTSTPNFSSTYGPTQSTPGNLYGSRYSTSNQRFKPNESKNKNYYETRPTYLPSSESPIGNVEIGQQRYPSGNVPSTTYRPNYSTTTGPTFGPNQREYEQNTPSPQRPIYGPVSTASDRNVGPNNPTGFSQVYTPNGLSATETTSQSFGQPTSFSGQGTELNSSEFGPQRFGPTDNGPSGLKKMFGEDFSGPKQPQSYDPETGYHYK